MHLLRIATATSEEVAIAFIEYMYGLPQEEIDTHSISFHAQNPY
jgi:hypothetical protein